jgi:hypothetical protein
MSDFASESGHWYRRDGSPCHEVPRAKGDGVRPTTLRDARKMGLLPSVTSIIKCADRPALNSWMQRQVAMSALTMRPAVTTSMNVQVAAIITDAKEQGMNLHEGHEIEMRPHELDEDFRRPLRCRRPVGDDVPPGKAYTRYTIVGRDGMEFSTFDKGHVQFAREAGTSEVFIQFAATKYGRDILFIGPAE